MVKVWLPPWTTGMLPLGVIDPFAPAVAMIVHRSMVKFPSPASAAAFPAASWAVARTRAVVVGALGTVQPKVPELATPEAIVFGKVAPPSDDQARSTLVTPTLSLAVQVIA